MPLFNANYASRRILEVIGDKWTPLVLYLLGTGIRRHGELIRQMSGISKKMLAQTLRRLEADGLLERPFTPRCRLGLTTT
jgi:DNA-binding HxlR family transcriptional regulator